jgi:hypothetical protein
VISGFRCGVNEIFALVGCYAAQIGSQLPTFRDNLSVPSSRATVVTLEDGTDTLSRNVGNYQYMLRNIPEDRRSKFQFYTKVQSVPHTHQTTSIVKVNYLLKAVQGSSDRLSGESQKNT